MATQRYISTTFWDDEWVQNRTPDEKLFYMYLLTNPLTNIAGVYKISDKRACFDTSIEMKNVVEMWELFERDKKAYRRGEWLIIPTWPKHQRWQQRRKIMLGIVSVLQEVPKHILTELEATGYQFDLSLVAGIVIARKERQFISGTKKQQLIKDSGDCCDLCGAKYGLVIHHIKAVENGGTNANENLQVLCEVCHGKKHTPHTVPDDMWSVDEAKTIPETQSTYPTNYLDPDIDIDKDIDRDKDINTKSVVFPNQQKLCQEVYRIFEKQYGSIMPDQSKQIDAVNRLSKLGADSGDPEIVIKAMMKKLVDLKEGDNGKSGFWRTQPFLPSTLVSLWARIREHIKTEMPDEIDWENLNEG